MTSPLSRCAEHDYYTEETCPHCGIAGERVLSGPRREQLSKFLSGALRHFPDDAGLALDEAGWTTWGSLVAAGFDVRKRETDTYTVSHVPSRCLSRDE